MQVVPCIAGNEDEWFFWHIQGSYSKMYYWMHLLFVLGIGIQTLQKTVVLFGSDIIHMELCITPCLSSLACIILVNDNLKI